MPTNATPKTEQEQPIAAKTKKIIRKAVAAPAKKAPVRKAATVKASSAALTAPPSLETLFTAQPNPYHAPAPPYIWIDYPVANETLHASEYVIRFGVGGADTVELSIDGGDWQRCRAASGYWWYDWSAIAPGRHTLVARMRTPEGAWYRTPACACAR